MLFNSLIFLLFLAIVLALHHLPLPWKAKKLNLCLASYVFYAAWNPPFVILLWISTLIDWLAGKRIAAARSTGARKGFLALSLTVNLALLGFFKYGGFLLDNFTALLELAGIHFRPAAPGIVLPVGISFYTFQSMSYSLDIYRGKLKPWPSFLDFALFVTFFPQLVAGPIVRAAEFLPQCVRERRATAEQFGWGLIMIILGLFGKVILADALAAPVADAVFAAPAGAGFVDAWIGTLAFSAQIFFDFAGYSTCAIGAALSLGFILPENFRFPYAALGFSEFWRRWHISLSSFLRDYLYFGMGGSRKGALRTTVNAAVTMLLGGLWHGAAWHFVIWGGIHGVLLAVERAVKSFLSSRVDVSVPGVRPALMLLTYFFICLTWVFFRAEDTGAAFTLLNAMAGGQDGALLPASAVWRISVITVLLLGGHWYLRDRDFKATLALMPWWLRSAVVAVLLLALTLVPGDDRAFIYFQF
ncbi:MAG: MBOAT family O-acyltransferase [Desulfobulbaceae bacterium]|jgi:alginate O-acetyltransferase complex protein AlgI|nr:MBOAT family protein [Desulfobulbaceae bacterium]MDY0351954.1 MBOAT family O-acyltransferase [Desulfobulbaceae bacterium]